MKEWMPVGAQYANTRSKRRRYIIGAAVLVLAVVILVIILFLGKDSGTEPLSSYDKALSQRDYEAVMEHYHEAQRANLDGDKSQSVRADNAKKMARIETDLGKEAEKIMYRLEQGGRLTEEDGIFIRHTVVVTGDSFVEFVARVTNHYLDGDINTPEFMALLEDFRQIPVLAAVVEPIIDNQSVLESYLGEFAKANTYIKEEKWLAAFAVWSKVREKEKDEIPTSLKRYLDGKHDLYAETVHGIYTAKIAEMIKYERYYSASQLLKKVLNIYPNDVQFVEWYGSLKDLVPVRHVTWNKAVEHISIRPLIVNSSLVFGVADSKNTENLMLTTTEFSNMLTALFDNDYVLVKGDAFVAEDGRYRSILVPAGKKPLVLVIEKYYFSPLRIAKGSAARLDIDENGEVYGLAPAPEGQGELIRTDTAIDILNKFCRDHPQFSFDGAKATLALTGNNGIFGYVTGQEMAENWNRERTHLGGKVLSFESSDFSAGEEKVKQIAESLRRRGYSLASYAWSGLDLALAEPPAIRNEMQKWRDHVESIIGDTHILHYPDGSHLQALPQKLRIVTEYGFTVLSGRGERVYMVSGKGYVHTDKVYVGGSDLLNPGKKHLRRFFNSGDVIDEKRAGQ